MIEQHEEQWLALCIHESAHSVVSAHVGFQPTTITMREHAGQARYVATRDDGFYARAIVVAAAAMAAETLIFGETFGHGEGDDKQIEAFAREGHLQDYHVAALRRVAASIVKLRRNEIMATACRLLQPGHYDASSWQSGAIQ